MDERTDRILQVAIELAENDGYEAVRLRDVASKAEVALGTVYRRFSCKEDILAAALNLQVSAFEQAIRLRPIDGDSPRERLTTLFTLATEALAELGAARTGEALRSLTDSDDRKLWFRACRIAQQHQVPGTTAALTALHARGRLDGPDSWRERLAQAMTVALRKQEDDAAEPTLLALLGDERGQVSRYAAEALATCGTVAAVPALQARHDALGVLSTERPVLNAAIRRIQARTSGEAGGLMIADAVPEAGAVSVADRQEKGRLAMAARAKE